MTNEEAAREFFRLKAAGPLRAIGVSRDLESPGERSVLVAFNRRLTDDELRALHDLLGRSS